MPKYVDANDASARTLNIYKEKNNNILHGKDKKEFNDEEIISYS